MVDNVQVWGIVVGPSERTMTIESDVMWTSSKQRASRCGDMLFGGRQIAKVDGHNVGVGLALGLG